MIDQIRTYIVVTAGIIVAFATVWFRGKQAGKQQSEAVYNEQILQNAQEAKDVEIEVDAMPDAAVRDELRKHWTRD